MYDGDPEGREYFRPSGRARPDRAKGCGAFVSEGIAFAMSYRAQSIAVILGLLFLGLMASSSEGFVSPLQDRPAPELASTTWINSDPLKLQDLRGKVVLLEFWTYG